MAEEQKTLTTESFNQNYAVLKQNAEKLRIQTEPDIDNLIPLVESSIKSYEICKKRIDAVKVAFDKLLPAED